MKKYLKLCGRIFHDSHLFLFSLQVVVIIVIWIISILVIYMLFLMCLEPLLNKRVKANNYQEHTNEDVHKKTHSKYSGIKYSRLTAVAADDDSDVDVDHHHDVIDDDDVDIVVQAQLVGNKEALCV